MPDKDPYALTEIEKTHLLQCSVERMINTSIRLAEYCMQHGDETMKELGDTSLQDFTEFKPIMCKLWDGARNQAFIERNKK